MIQSGASMQRHFMTASRAEDKRSQAANDSGIARKWRVKALMAAQCGIVVMHLNTPTTECAK